MNKHDRDNLEFLLSATPDIIADWYSKMSEDDIAYAKELLAQAELEFAALAEAKMDCTEANALLSKFTLKGSK